MRSGADTWMEKRRRFLVGRRWPWAGYLGTLAARVPTFLTGKWRCNCEDSLTFGCFLSSQIKSDNLNDHPVQKNSDHNNFLDLMMVDQVFLGQLTT